MNDSTSDPISAMKRSDPGRSLPSLDEPWRMREKILMNNQTQHNTSQTPATYSRRDRVVQVLGALGISAAVWGLIAVSGGSSLPTIALANGGRSVAAGASNSEADADNKMAIWAPMNYEFVLDDGVNIAAGKEKVYRWVGPTKQEVQALADKLGVDGTLNETPSDQGGGWHIGDMNTYTEGSTYFVAMANGSFSYSSMMAMKSGVICEPATAPDSSSSSGTSADGTGSSGENDTPCEGMPEPVKNLPTKSEAQEKLTEFFGDITDVNIYEDPYSVYASGATSTGNSELGDAAKQWVSMSFGENGTITSVYGMLGHLEEVGAYPTISAREAVERLAQMQFLFGGDISNRFGVARGIASSGSGSAPAGDSVTSDSVLVDPIPVPSDSVPAPEVTIETIPAQPIEPVVPSPMPTDPGSPSTTVPVQTVTVRLVKVTVVYQQLWDATGVMWIVPAYQYTDSDGGIWIANAVNSKYLDLVQPAPMVMMGAAD